jgi:5-methylcytosine-specific restriction endonuclease McrA
MILSKTVVVTLANQNIPYYESKGIHIPRYKYWSNRNATFVKRGTKIEINVKDLMPGSGIPILMKCDNCGKENWVIYQNIDKSGKYLCCDCSNKTESHRQNISLALTGRKLSKEHIQHMRENSVTPSGPNHPWWNPNLTDEDRKQQRQRNYGWKMKVKSRDDYTCQKCGYVGHKNDGVMHSHHINSYSLFPELRTDEKNGITLCNNCHLVNNNFSLHNIYGEHPTQEDYCNFMKGSYLEKKLQQQLIDTLKLL